MKTIFTLVLLLLLAGLVRAQTITTITLTSTNNLVGATNGQTIILNGVTRTFTNNVTAAANQIQAGTNDNTTATNLFYAYVGVPASGVNVSLLNSNVVRFQSFIGRPLGIVASRNLANNGWATLVTNTYVVTNYTVFRGYASWVGDYERTNTANGIVSYLADRAVTNAIPTNVPAMTNYATANELRFASNSIVGQITGIGNGATNLAYYLANALTNDVMTASNNLAGTIAADYSTLNTTIYQVGTDATNNTSWTSNALITQLISLGLSYLVGNDIKLHNGDGTYRMEADQGGNFNLFFDDGISFPFLTADTAHNVLLKDHAGTVRMEQYDAAGNNGATFMRSASGNDGLIIAGLSDAVKTHKPVTFNANSDWPATALGTTTNFITAVGNSGTGATTRNQFNVPANTLTNNGDSVVRTIGVTYAASTATKRTEVYFAGTQIYDTGAVANSGSGSVSITCEITRVDSSTISYRCQGTATGTASATTAKVGTVGGLDFTTAINCYVILTSGVGGASNDFQIIQDNTRLCPSPAWGGFN